VTLALSIGLTTAIYSVVNALLLRPLAYSHPERMVWLSTRAKTRRATS
jgi:putative ABC transport system permease protein